MGLQVNLAQSFYYLISQAVVKSKFLFSVEILPVFLPLHFCLLDLKRLHIGNTVSVCLFDAGIARLVHIVFWLLFWRLCAASFLILVKYFSFCLVFYCCCIGCVDAYSLLIRRGELIDSALVEIFGGPLYNFSIFCNNAVNLLFFWLPVRSFALECCHGFLVTILCV